MTLLGTKVRYALVCILGGVLAGQLAACDDGLDVATNGTFREPTTPKGVEVASDALVNPGMIQCSSSPAGPISGWVRITRGEEGYSDPYYPGDLHCNIVAPNSSLPDLWHYAGGDQWYYRDQSWVADNVGAAEFFIPPGRCVRIQMWNHDHYQGTSVERMHCNAPGNGTWSAGTWRVRGAGVWVSSIKTAYCEYNGGAWPACNFNP